LPARRYAGIELEVSQALASGNEPKCRSLQTAIAVAMRDAIADLS
jgi:hypothetical protein